jgi:pSer/pThr/pTyr-binding forkhead associated (FHA) protein
VIIKNNIFAYTYLSTALEQAASEEHAKNITKTIAATMAIIFCSFQTSRYHICLK